MKRIAAIILTCTFVLSLAGCSAFENYEIKIVIPAGSEAEMVYSEEEVSPNENQITLWAGAGLGDTTVVLKPVGTGKEDNYIPTYITPGMPVKMDAEEGAWYQIGVSVQNPTEEDITVYVNAKDCTVRRGGNEVPDNLIRYEQGTNEEEGYAYLEYGDKRFVPYCAYEKKYLGDCIGYCDIPAEEYTDASRVYVFELKGYSSDEWIIEMPELDNCSEGMILREINAEDVPEGLVSEYEWN